MVFKGLSPQRHRVLRDIIFREERLEKDETMRSFFQSYLIARQIDNHQVLTALAALTKEQGGLKFWEKIAERMKENPAT